MHNDTLSCSLNRAVSASVRVPGDKSISHRSLILGALAIGETQISGFLEAEDCLNTLNIMRQLGVEIAKEEQNITVHGVGLQGLKRPRGTLDCGNSGTGMRLISGVLAGQNFSSTLIGDDSLSSRPMARIIQPLRQMGADIESINNTAPLTFKRVNKLHAIHHQSPIASAQVKSCILLAGLSAQGQTSVSEPIKSRDHTEKMLTGFGYEVSSDGLTVGLEGGGQLFGQRVEVPADISSAAFFMVLAACTPSSVLKLSSVCVNPTRDGVIHILKLMGADIRLSNEREVAGELLADITVCYAPLKAIDIPKKYIASAIDEFPVIFVAAACASGTTTLEDANELRHKESDRISVMIKGLQDLGIECCETEDGAQIVGGAFASGVVDACHDHRCAMSFLIAGCLAEKDTTISVKGCRSIATSFPNFVDLLSSLGARVAHA